MKQKGLPWVNRQSFFQAFLRLAAVFLSQTAHLLQGEYPHMISGDGFKPTDKIRLCKEHIPFPAVRKQTGMLLQAVKGVDINPLVCPETSAKEDLIFVDSGYGDRFGPFLGRMLSPPHARMGRGEGRLTCLIPEYEKFPADFFKKGLLLVFQFRQYQLFKNFLPQPAFNF